MMFSPPKVLILLSFLFLCATAQDVHNCDVQHWLPAGSSPPINKECEDYDGSKVPDCGAYIHNNVTSYYHIHEYDCTKFWECSPQGPCLFACAPCADNQCDPYDGLLFDCRYQGDLGPVCDWPYAEGIMCFTETTTPHPATTTTPTTTTEDPGCITDDDCADTEWCDTTVFPGECKLGCRDDTGCSGMVCSTCQDHVCHDPQCCSDQDCPDLTNMVCSTCSSLANTCSNPECCLDTDCPEGFVCEDEQCVEKGECDAERPCEGADGVCNEDYTNCQYCDLEALECKPGCDSDDNCEGEMVCNGFDHRCQNGGVNGISNITVTTQTCSQCAGSGNPLGYLEGGLRLHLIGEYSTSCHSMGLDNLEKVDYDNGVFAFFDGQPDDDGDDDGLGECKNADLNYGVRGGSATWTGQGTWTASSKDPVCIQFFPDPAGDIVTCCCSLDTPSLAQEESSELDSCSCFL